MNVCVGMLLSPYFFLTMWSVLSLPVCSSVQFRVRMTKNGGVTRPGAWRLVLFFFFFFFLGVMQTPTCSCLLRCIDVVLCTSSVCFYYDFFFQPEVAFYATSYFAFASLTRNKKKGGGKASLIMYVLNFFFSSHDHTHAILIVMYTIGCIANYSHRFLPAWKAVSSLFYLHYTPLMCDGCPDFLTVCIITIQQ